MQASLLLIGACAFVLALVCLLVVGYIRRVMQVHQLELLARDIHAHGLETLWSLPLACSYCKRTRRLVEFRYGVQQYQKQVLICSRCARRLDRQLAQVQPPSALAPTYGMQPGRPQARLHY
jgi:hypothetical protein